MLIIMSKNREKYSTDPFGKKHAPRRSFFGMLLVIILMALTLSFSVALLIAYITPYVSPSAFGSLTIVGLFAPILFICVAACMLMWIVLGYWKTAAAVLLLLLPGIFRFTDFYSIDLMREVEEKAERSSFTLMSYNVRAFGDDEGEPMLDSLVNFMASSDLAEVVCFQEFKRNAKGIERLDSLFNRRYKRCYKSDVEEYSGVVLRTYSCYPIIASGEISCLGRGTTQWNDIVVRNDTLRIFNNHLNSTDLTASDSEDIGSGEILGDSERMLSIVDRIANNSTIRAEHVDTLRHVIDHTPYESIVCGDFNDTPMSYVYRELSRDLVDAFVEQGRGYGYTFRPMHGMLRIDYILHSKGLSSLYYYANEHANFSDHLPIVARLKFNE